MNHRKKTSKFATLCFNEKKIIAEYRKIAKIFNSSENERSLSSLVSHFLSKYVRKKRFEFVIKSLRKLDCHEKKSPEYYCTMGRLYLLWAIWQKLICGKVKRVCKHAIYFFEKLMKLKSENPEFCVLPALAYAIIGSRKKTLQTFKNAHRIYRKEAAKGDRWFVLKYFPILRGVAGICDAYHYYYLADYWYYVKKNKEKSMIYLRRALESDEYHPLSNLLSGIISKDNKGLDRALESFKLCSLAEPEWPDPYYAMSLILCTKLDYEAASQCLLKAKKLAYLYYSKTQRNFYHNIIALYYYTIGMAKWREGLTEEAYRCFFKSASYVRKNRLRGWQSFQILPLILQLDKEILKLPQKKKLADLRNCVRRLYFKYLKLFGTNRIYHSLDIVIDDVKFKAFVPIKLHFIATILSVLDRPFHESYESFLKKINAKQKFSTPSKNTKNKNLLINLLEFQKDQLLRIGFYSIVQAVNSLENFVLETKRDIETYSSIDEIPPEKQIQLIRSLTPFSTTIDGEATHFQVNRILTKDDFRKEMQFFKSHLFKKVKQFENDLESGVKEVIKSEFKRIRKESEISEKKIKALPKYYVEFKGKIVAIYLKRDGEKKLLFKGKRTPQPYQLLEYFLSREDRRIHWVEAIKIFPDWQVKRKTEKEKAKRKNLKRRKDITGLKDIFGGVLGKISTDFNKIREQLLKENIITEKINIEEHRGFYTLTTQIQSNITDAKNLIKEALKMVDDDFDTANKKIIEALQTYDKCIEAAILILELKDKAKFGNKIMDNAQSILIERKDILEQIIKPTVDYYIRETEKLGWRKTQINEKIEFNNYTETLANDIDHEIEIIKKSLKGIPKTQDEGCEEIKKLMKRDLYKIENSNALLKKEPIKELIDNLMHRTRDRQSKDKFERNWAWFKNITTDKKLIELLKSCLIDAIERGKIKLNAQFIRAKILKDLLKHLDRMTMAVAMEEMYRQKTNEELSKKQLIDLRKAKKLYAQIMAEYEKKGKGNPTREDVIGSIIVKSERDRPFAERVLWLLEKGSELSFDDTRYGQKDSNDIDEN
jgi:hypothetical protein